MAGAYNSTAASVPGDAIAGLDEQFNAVEGQLENVATELEANQSV
jgi:hypothetical protein